MILKFRRRCSSDHIESSFGHVGMWMELLFARTIENTFHGGDINNPGGSAAYHFVLELTDQMKGDNRVDDLGRIAIKQ